MPNKRNLLHLITGLEIGGAEMMLLKTLPGMQDDFDNRVCCIKGHGLIGKKLEESGIPVYYLGLINIFDIRIIWNFRKVIKEFKPDILVTYLIHADLFGRIFGRIFGVRKIVCSQRGSLLRWEFLRFFDKLTRFLVTKYIVQTKTAKKNLMAKLNLPEEKFRVIPNAIDLQEFNFELDIKKKKKDLGINNENMNIVCVSKLRKGKGHEHLLEAFENVFAENKHLNLLIVGDGEQKNRLLRQIENYSCKNNIYFLGNRSDVKEILKISDIFVLPTLGEGMSNAIMEAMVCGLPVITTDIPENKELITNNENGLLIPLKNVNFLEEAIKKIIYNKDLGGELGENAKEKMRESFDINIIASKFVHFFNSL